MRTWGMPLAHARVCCSLVLAKDLRACVRWRLAQGPIPLTEPFRVVLSHLRDRLYRTREVRMGGRDAL